VLDKMLDTLDGLLLQQGRSRLWVAQRYPAYSCYHEQKDR